MLKDKSAEKRKLAIEKGEELPKRKKQKQKDKAAGRRESVPPATEDDEELTAFIAKHGLNDDALSYLKRLPVEVRAVLLPDFRLQPGAKDPTGVLISFGQKVKRKLTGDTGARKDKSNGKGKGKGKGAGR